MTALELKQAWDAAVKPPAGWQGDLYFCNRLHHKIRYGHAPAQGPRKGTVVLTHGYGENIDLYYETTKRFQAMGYDVWAMDWQGHGKSDRDDPENPLRPDSKGMLRHTQDLDFFVTNVVKPYHDPKTPLILNTHSMGGHIALLYLKKYPGVFDAAVMSVPMFDIYRLNMGSWARPVVRAIFNAASRLGLRNAYVPSIDNLQTFLPGLGKRLVDLFLRPTGVRSELREMMRTMAPETKLERPTFGWIAAAYKTIVPSLSPDFLKSIKTPVLIATAPNEDLVANDEHDRVARLMPNAKHVTIADAHHGLWFEQNAQFEEWWGHIRTFIVKVNPVNPHEAERNKTIDAIIGGKNVAQTLRGRIIETPRGPET